MTPTDTSEKGLESLIVAALVGAGSQKHPAGIPTGEQPGGYSNLWYVQGDPKDYDREHAVDLAKLLEFLKTNQPDDFDALGLASEGHRRQAFLHRLQGEIAKRGIVEETDPNKLHDLKADLDGAQVYAQSQIEEFVTLYLGGAEQGKIDPILDACVVTYKQDLDEGGQVAFKGKAKSFTRTYAFLADHTELFKQFQDNPSFKKWLEDTVFAVNYNQPVVGP